MRSACFLKKINVMNEKRGIHLPDERKRLDDLTFIFVVRIDSLWRLRNLRSVLAFLTDNFDSNFLIIEADSTSRIPEGSLPQRNLKFIFEKDENPILHRTMYINRLFRMAETRFAAVWDVDVLCVPENISASLELLSSSNTIMTYPYDGKFWHVNPFFSSVFHRSGDLSVITEKPQPRILMNGYHSVGGAFFVNIEKYRDAGWENEYFIGWGPEDMERFKRLEILGEKPLRVKGDLYHLFHTRGENSGEFNADLMISTKREYCKVCGMNTTELRNYINGWEWIR